MRQLLVAGMAYLDVFVPPCAPPAPGQEVFVEAITLALGGACNSASVAAALGVDVTLCVPQGAGMADAALTVLAARLGIALAPLPAPDNPAVSLVLAERGERAFISAASFAALDQATALPDASWILVPGLEEAARLALPLARARQRGARVAVSGSWRPQRLAELGQIANRPWDLLVVNASEAQAACGDVAQAPRLLAGAAASVLVTRGAAGAFGVLESEAVDAAAPCIDVIDTTGAGDAFCAGLLAALIGRRRPADAIGLAARAAAHIVQQQGGLLQDPARIAALRRETEWKH